MRIALTLSREQVAALRRQRYLELWPLHAQAEAIQDHANGRPEKLTAMNADFDRIRAELPWPDPV